MGAIPSQLQEAGDGNKLKIVNNVTPLSSRSGDKQDVQDQNTDVQLLVSITKDKTVVISEANTTGTQTEELKINENVNIGALNEFVLITENSEAPIQTTLTTTQGTETFRNSQSKIDNESKEDEILVKEDSDVTNPINPPEPVDTPEEEHDVTDFVFDTYDPAKKGEHIDYETATLERYGKYKVKLSRDASKCIISAATFLDTGDVIIIDRSNQRIKYIDANFQYISSYELPHKPWAVCARGGDVYVSMGNTKIQHVFVKDMIIEPERILDITGRCLGICILGEYIAVGLQIGEISLIDTMGVPQKTIQLPTLEKGGSCNPWHLSVTHEQNILVTDSDAESIFCINMESEVLFTFKMFSSPRGTAVDNRGNIILAGRDKTSGAVVVILSRDFELQSTLHIEGDSEGRNLLTWAELEFVPYCVAYRPDNVVVLGGIQEALKIMRIVNS